MDREEAEHKILQFCQLRALYAENSVELKKSLNFHRKAQLQHAKCTYHTFLI